MAVFAVGFAAVASLFPTGAVLQRDLSDSAIALQVARNVRSLIKGRKFQFANLNTSTDPQYIGPSLMVQPILKNLDPPGKYGVGQFERWKLNDRSYFFSPISPQDYYYPSQDREIVRSTGNASEFNRTFYWVPLIRRTAIPATAQDWQVFVFILRAGELADPNHGYNRSGTGTAWWGSEWANFDGKQPELKAGLGPYWSIPGVYGATVEMDLDVPTLDRFKFDNRFTRAVGDESPTALEIQIGDYVLDNNGTIHTVRTADADGINVKTRIPTTPNQPNVLWYGRPPYEGKTSPTKLIIAIDDAVE